MTTPTNIRFTAEESTAIDEYAERRGLRRSSAVRELLRFGLAHAGAAQLTVLGTLEPNVPATESNKAPAAGSSADLGAISAATSASNSIHDLLLETVVSLRVLVSADGERSIARVDAALRDAKAGGRGS